MGNLDADRRPYASDSEVGVILADANLAQGLVEAFADLSDCPITLIQKLDIGEFFQEASKNSFFRGNFGSVQSFCAFLRLANTAPNRVLRELNEAPLAWRSILEDLEDRLLITRPTRVEPVIRLLREHWTWRWCETLALTD